MTKYKNFEISNLNGSKQLQNTHDLIEERAQFWDVILSYHESTKKVRFRLKISAFCQSKDGVRFSLHSETRMVHVYHHRRT